jgi:hypothetical protein
VVAHAIRNWTDEDLEAFLSGQRELTIRVPARSARQRPRDRNDSRELAARIRDVLSAMETRDDGQAYLEALALSRDELKAVVNALDLPQTKSDNMDALKSRVVENLIGYRLRSQAIRGRSRSDLQKRTDDAP